MILPWYSPFFSKMHRDFSDFLPWFSYSPNHYYYWIWMTRLDLLLLHFQRKKQESREPWLCDMCSLLHWTPYTLHLLRDAIDSALTLLVGWPEGYLACKKTEWWDVGMVICLGWGVDLYMAQQMLLPLTISCSSKSRLVLPSCFYFSGAGSPG